MLPLVSVIVPAYNAERFIRETLRSAVHQTYTHFELLVVDDGSTDRQKEIIDEFVSADSRVRYYYQKNQGVSAARNYGFLQSKGQLISFLDSDDVWLPENLQLKIDKFKDGDFGLVHSDAMVIDEWSNDTEHRLSGKEGYVLDGLLSWDGTQIPGPSSILIKRTVLEKVGLFDLSLSTTADKDLFIRISAHFKIGRVAKVTWRYRMHQSNMHRNIQAMEADVLWVYAKARQAKLFKNNAFEKHCFLQTYLVLAACWAGDGKSLVRAIRFLLKAMKKRPGAVGAVVKRVFGRWRAIYLFARLQR